MDKYLLADDREILKTMIMNNPNAFEDFECQKLTSYEQTRATKKKAKSEYERMLGFDNCYV